MIGLSLLIMLGAALFRPASGSIKPDQLTGKMAPSFQLPTFSGQYLGPQQYKGQPLILNFWATWCGYCREELKLLQHTIQPGEPEVLGVLIYEHHLDYAQQFIKQTHLPYPQVIDQHNQVGQKYGVHGVPVTVFIDSKGIIQHIQNGALSPQALKHALQKITLQ